LQRADSGFSNLEEEAENTPALAKGG